MFHSYGPNRYICSVFDEMRECIKTLNFSYMKSLIEEAQVMANRMEAALSDQSDVRELSEQRRKLNKELKALYEERTKLKEELADLKKTAGKDVEEDEDE